MNRFPLLIAACYGVVAVEAQSLKPLYVPPEISDPPWLEDRRAGQRTAAEQFDVFHQFSFFDQLEQSGIRFRNQITEESGKHWLPIHYDHGNGIAVADVDGDGWHDLYLATQAGTNELWRNLGDGKFADITTAAGVGVAAPIGVTASFADIDNDGDPDLYATVLRAGNRLFANDGTGKFADIAAQSRSRLQGTLLRGLVLRLQQRRLTRWISRQRRQLHYRRSHSGNHL